MIELDRIKLSDIMPANLLKDNIIRAMCEALDIQITKLVDNNKKLSLYANIDNLPESIIDYLAWQFHVDFYEDTLTLQQKRDSVKKSIVWHKHKGTVGVVEDYVTTIFGGAKVYEWFDYDGEPYHFKIDLITAEIPTPKALQRIIEAIFTIKNTRSWCDEIGFLRNLRADIHYASIPYIHNDFEIFPATIKDAEVSAVLKIAGLSNLHKEFEVFPVTIKNTEINNTLHIANLVNVHKEIEVF